MSTAAHQLWMDSQWFARWLALARHVAALFACVWGVAATTIDSGSGLTLGVGSTGAFTNITVASVDRTFATGGFEIADFSVSTNTFNSVTGTTSAIAGGVSVAATNSNVGLFVSIVTNSGTIAITGTLTNLTTTDRAIALRVRIPANLTGWMWHEDSVSTRTISGSTKFKNVTTTEAGAGEQSIYPLAAISSGTNGITLATPITFSPRVYTLVYDSGSTGLLATAYLSLSTNALSNAGSSSFSFMLHPANGANAFRASLAKQYALYPAAFTPRQSFQAAYRWGMGEYITATNSLYIGPSNIYTNGSDFGASYDYITSVHGCYYSAKWTTNSPGLPSDTAIRAWLATVPADPYSSVIAGSNAVQQLEEDASGALRFLSSYDGSTWSFIFRVNEDPAITDALPQMLDASITNYPAHTAYKPAITVDGADGFVGMTQLDYSPAHIRAMSYPPTFGAASLKPAVVNQIWDFYNQYLWPRSAANTFTVSGNSGSPDLVHVAPFLDIFMSEGTRTWSDFRSYRALAGKKIVRNWTTITPWATYTDAEFDLELNQCLSLGMYPSLAMLIYGDRIETFRPLYRLYQPAITRLSAAGWEPVTYATAANAVVERFGNWGAGTLCFSISNSTTNSITTSAVIDKAALRISARRIAARDLLTNRGTAINSSGAFSLTLTNGQTKAFSIYTLCR